MISQQPVISNNITKGDEAAAMAAMFQAQTANWEETQEKMSQLVLPFGAFCLRSSAFSNEHFLSRSLLLVPSVFALETVPNEFTPTHGEEMRLSAEANRSPLTKIGLCLQVTFVIVAGRKVGKLLYDLDNEVLIALHKGHWIQDCPTNNDREFDNRPRIKRTTGIPRSMLKAVENPNGDIGQGVMVTPEGGYVVAQPDLYVFLVPESTKLVLKSSLIKCFMAEAGLVSC